MENNLKYYFDFLSQPSRALYILLKDSRTNFEAHQVNLLELENRSDDYKKINRFQKVPAIIDFVDSKELHLAESVAILRYLVQTNKISVNFYPMDLQKRALVDEFLEWQHSAIRTSCSLYFRFTWVQTKVFGSPCPEEKVAKYRLLMEKDLHLMEHVWLRDRTFLVGNTVTAADVFGACEVEQIRCTGYEVKYNYPNIYKWIENVRKAIKPYFEEAHQHIYNIEKETKSVQ